MTGGRNGYGAKLANIFSTKFVVETADGKRGRRYKQTFTKNMSKKGEPIITCASERGGMPSRLPAACKQAAAWRGWQTIMLHTTETGAASAAAGELQLGPLPATCPASMAPCSDCKSNENWTCITFYPDLERFGMAGEGDTREPR